MRASPRNLIEQIKAVVFEKGELQSGDISQLEALLPLLSKQESKSDVRINNFVLHKRTVCLRYEAID